MEYEPERSDSTPEPPTIDDNDDRHAEHDGVRDKADAPADIRAAFDSDDPIRPPTPAIPTWVVILTGLALAILAGLLVSMQHHDDDTVPIHIPSQSSPSPSPAPAHPAE